MIPIVRPDGVGRDGIDHEFDETHRLVLRACNGCDGKSQETLRPRLTREDTPPLDDGVPEGLELALIEARPDHAREPIEVLAVHPAHEPAPALNDNGRG